MGSGGSRTLWSPSYGDGEQIEILEIVRPLGTSYWRHHLAEIDQIDRTVDDGGTLKREKSN